MGTHPIFESDFDCLTESMSNLLEVAAKNPFNKPVIADAAPSCEFGSTEYYAKCMIGGALSCGLTHTAVVPLDLVRFDRVLCEVHDWWSTFVWVDSSRRRPARSRQVPNAGRRRQVPKSGQGHEGHHRRRGRARIGPRLGADADWLLDAGHLQVWLLRDFQEHVRRHDGRGERLSLQNATVLDRFRLRRVLCRHRSLPNGSCQGSNPNF